LAHLISTLKMYSAYGSPLEPFDCNLHNLWIAPAEEAVHRPQIVINMLQKRSFIFPGDAYMFYGT